MSLKAVIFDKDGVLIDTEPGIVLATQKTLEHFGGKAEWYSLEDRIWSGGIPAKITFEKLFKEHNMEVNVDEVNEFYHNYHIEFLNQNPVKVFEGVKELLAALKNEGVKIAVATGSNKIKSDLNLKQAGLENVFDTTVTSDEVVNPKPAPDSFLEAAKRVGADPSESVVVGDSHNDRLGAKGAGMKFVLIRHTYEKQIDNMHPDLVTPSLKDLKVDVLKSLFD